ncbi:MAG: class I SAM-dependent methyltransferase [Sphingomicrobium sp.]
MIDNEGVICREQAQCVVCGSPGREIHAGMRDRLFGAPGMWSIFRCSDAHCGLGWLHPQPLPSEVIKFYENYHTHRPTEAAPVAADPRATGSLRQAWRSSKRARTRLLRVVLPWWRLRVDAELSYIGRRKPGRVLEVGCGSGQFLSLLQEAGWDAIGLDFDPEAVSAARQRGVNAQTSDLFAQNFPAESFDIVFMDNVIEHLPDPPAVFAECHRVLRPGGRLILLTPNLNSDLHELYGADWRGLEIPRHLYLFCSAAMRKLARSAGFSQVEIFSQPVLAFNVGLMIDQSKLIAERSGRAAPEASPQEYLRRAARLSWLRSPRGEFLVLVAER